MRPHLWITPSRQVHALWVLVAAVVVVGLILDQFRPPNGWLALEFPAWTGTSGANDPMSWSAQQREDALFGLGLDSLFLFLYPLLLSLLCARAAQHWNLPAPLARACMVCSALVLLAAPLDALENAGLYHLLNGSNSETLRVFITAVSAPKWLLGIAAFVLWAGCVPVHWWRSRAGTRMERVDEGPRS